MIIVGERNWALEYQKGDKPDHVWIMVKQKDVVFFLETFEDWLKFKKTFDKDSECRIDSIGFRYKSHVTEKDASNSDGVYLIKCIKGTMGGRSNDTFVTGIIRGDKVYKTVWSLPALIAEEEHTDGIETCFEEALIYYGKEPKA